MQSVVCVSCDTARVRQRRERPLARIVDPRSEVSTPLPLAGRPSSLCKKDRYFINLLLMAIEIVGTVDRGAEKLITSCLFWRTKSQINFPHVLNVSVFLYSMCRLMEFVTDAFCLTLNGLRQCVHVHSVSLSPTLDGLRQCVHVHSVSLSDFRWASPVCTCTFCQSVWH